MIFVLLNKLTVNHYMNIYFMKSKKVFFINLQQPELFHVAGTKPKAVCSFICFTLVLNVPNKLYVCSNKKKSSGDSRRLRWDQQGREVQEVLEAPGDRKRLLFLFLIMILF